MKGITSNPALDAYQRMAISPIGSASRAQPATPVEEVRAPSAEVAKVTISAEARQLAVGTAEKASDPEKVARLREQVSSGNFQVDSKQIAARMLAALG
jgi:flagellar biosynthesis anti-sigma factor FlgM